MTEITEIAEITETALSFRDYHAFYGTQHVLKGISFDIPAHSIFAFIGPSGCGKTTLLRSINRLNDLTINFHSRGDILLHGSTITALKDARLVQQMRRGIGMVFQQPNPLLLTVYQNMALPYEEHYRVAKEVLNSLIEAKLGQAGLWDEVKDKLHQPAQALSGGQQQRLCIARALMLEPSVILLDEPCSALDPIATYTIEDLLQQLKERHTIILVTHNLEQARRVADYTAFFDHGELIEHAETTRFFSMPQSKRLEDYITRAI